MNGHSADSGVRAGRWILSKTAAALVLIGGILTATAPRPQGQEPTPLAPSTADTLLHAEVPPCGANGQPPPSPLPLPPDLEARRLELLRGKCALQTGRLDQAEAIFRQGLSEDKNLPRLWRLYLFAALKQSGRHIEALATLPETLKGTSRNYVKERVRQVLMAGSPAPVTPARAVDPKASSGAIAVAAAPTQTPQDVEFDYLATYLANVRPGPEDYDLLQRLLALATPRSDDGLMRRIPVLLWRHPKNETAALLGTSVLGPAGARPIRTGEDFVERSRRLAELRLSRLEAAELEGVLPAAEPETARKLGRAYFGALLQLRDYRKAADALERGAGTKRFAFDERENVAWAVRAALRQRNTHRVLELLARLETLDPNPEPRTGFYLDLARQYEGHGDLEPLTEWCTRVIEASPGSNAAGAAYWMLVWNHFRRRDEVGALTWADKALAATPPLPWDHIARVLYWKGRLEAVRGEADAARQAWGTLVQRWPSTYYGLVAEQAGASPQPARFARIQHRPDAAGEPPHLEAVWKHPALSTALFAYAAGEDSAAESLLQEAFAQPLPKDVVKELAGLFLALNEHHLQQRLIANQGPYELVQVPVGDTAAWRQAFPPAFWDLVVDEAGAEDISPYFILAVMREESRFKVKADSRAGAKGLMQVMPSTAVELARKRRINLDEAALLLPEFNIPIGALYLRDVLRQFDWNPIYAAAAYNAGPGSVMRWSREWGAVPFDEFVERIPFEETQSYVKRVYSSYMIYRKLYP